LIGVTPTYLVKILFFLPARLNLPFVAPGPIFWLHTTRTAVRRNTPFCCRLIMVGNKRNILRLCLMRETRTRREGAIILINAMKYKINNYQQQ